VRPDMPIVEEAAGGSAGAPLATEPEMLEVWRPGRMGDRRRVHARQRGRAKQIRGEPAVLRQPSPESSASEPGTTALGAVTEGTTATEPARRADADAKPRRQARQRRQEDRIDRQDRYKRQRPPGKWFEPREPREKRPDPNSPFAKLAALKAQLEADAKERR
jgi:ATP-dependent RNA helicase SUPV3L1/SUV3